MAFILKLFVLCFIANLGRCVPLDDLGSRMSRLDITAFNSPNELVGKSLREWIKSKKKGNPEEQGSYFEGDIIIDIEGRNGINFEAKKWKDAIVPYKIVGSFSPVQKNLISDAIDHLQSHTCIKFVPQASEKNYVQFDNKLTGCWSMVGVVGGPQTINLQTPGCMRVIGTIVHEILHALGFYHEQSRYDRDDHVKIHYSNIPADRKVNFDKMSEDEQNTFGVDYDVESILHYSPFSFPIDSNQMTIESKIDKKFTALMGQRNGLSKKDIEKINAMYCK